MSTSSNEKITRADLDATLETHRKSIELQILIAEQLSKIIEKQESFQEDLHKVEERVNEINKHLTNGLKDDIKEHTEKCIEKCDVEIKKIITDHDDEVRVALAEIKKMSTLINDRGWKQAWLWGGILVFTLTSALSLIIKMLLS
jgi:predicted phage-related endonuclease